MSIHAGLTHRTSYRYDRRVGLGPQIVRLRPAPHARTPILSYALKIEPEGHFLNWQQDPFGNWQARLVFPEKVEHFDVTVDLVADMAAINPFDFFLEPDVYHVPFGYPPELKAELAPYLEQIPGGPMLDALVAEVATLQSSKSDYETINFLVDVNQLLQHRIGYTIRMEPGVQAPEQTLSLGTGSCRDSGWLMVALLRRLGYAARFVSGYLIQLTSDQKSIDGGPDGPETDFTDLHAWTEVYAPGAGWIGLDPTSGLFAGEGHIPLAATPSPSSAAPISGAVEPAKVHFDFEMDVHRVYERPRVSMPHTDEQWNELLAAGDAVDAKLFANDVRLTMGGEPTFIASTDRDADEWNAGAVGPTKRLYADKLIRRLRDRFAPGGLLQYGQGKWYPGEQLPRWAFALLWRADGSPLWENPELIASETAQNTAGPAEAERFAKSLAEALDVDPDFAQPAFEDPAEFLLRERKLAPNLDPIDNKIDDPEERQRLSRVFDRGLETPVSYVLPIQAAQARDHNRRRRTRRFKWFSERWMTRRGRLFLIPGDSPAGFRLPLRSLTWIDEMHYPHVHPLDPFARRGALPKRAHRFQARYAATAQPLQPIAPDLPFPSAPGGYEGGTGMPAPLDQPSYHSGGFAPANYANYGLDGFEDVDLQPMYDEVGWLPMEDVAVGGAFWGGGSSIRTAIAVEARNGVLNVFIPPTHSTDEYVDLINAIEEAAEATGLPVHVEGYPPPHDPRLNVIKVTPDPGVLEINIHPATNWRDQVSITEQLYEEARLCGLEASKFMVDGRPTGSGGGAHVVVGGATPDDSPFLRRPDLLGSLIRYWQNHPSLSYLFSGLFIGPTSQAPRIDEARHDSLYELEIALNQIPDPSRAMGHESPPWLVDRLLRHLMTDVTGNTHRAEICIDKLFSPDGPTGRLGLVEFRAFEMPPHPKMNLAQMLVLRALIARFWEKPYTHDFIRFGTHLHDRYMLPHYLWQDFLEVLSETSDVLGVKLDPTWFNSQFEFRFPRYGSVWKRGVEMELRAGIEPWHVLGEEGAVGGTTRFVDSSVERLQVRVTGDLSDRYVATCNGWRLPLERTDRADEQVAGVRFRTWLPASALHPTIPPHGPLIFDLVDTWNGRSLGGCTYHVTHQGGRNFETQPVNALEAEGRRKSRFQDFGHTPGPFTIYEPRMSPEAPSTLDMRLQHKA